GGEDSSNESSGGAGNAGTSGEGGSAASTTAANGGNRGGNGPTEDPSANGGQSAGGTAAVRSGQILLVSLRGNPTPARVMIANFFNNTASNCVSQAYGDCTFTPPCSTPYEPLYVDAGTLSVTSPNSAINISMTPSADNTYVSVSSSVGLSGGEALHFAATGGAIPAFSSDVTVALVLLIDAPVPNDNGEISASTTEDLVVRFSRSGAGVQLHVQSTTENGTLVCISAPAVPTLTIPAGALSALGSGATLSLWTLTSRVVTAGGFDITTGALMDAFTPDKAHAVTVKVQ
ncbi:MAG TPA: hypothetical protein VIV60_18110, partial [Polyangiaceae bacterium]